MAILRSRGPLLGVLLMQTVLTLGLANSAPADEAAHLYGGHRLLDHFAGGLPLDDDYDARLAGLPYLHPLLAAWIDGAGGLAAARALGLLCTLAATWLVHATAARLFEERAAFFAAALLGLSAPVLCAGNLATSTAPALALLAASLHCAVRSADRESASAAAPVLAFLAIATAYPSWLFVLPVAAAEAALAARQLGPRRAVRRGALFLLQTAVPTACVLFLTALYDGNSVLRGIAGALARDGEESAAQVAALAVDCTGAVLLLALVGAVLYTRGADPEHGRPTGVRALLGAALTGGALLTPLTALWRHSAESLETSSVFGLLLAAPAAGLLLARISHHGTRSAAAAVALLAATAGTAGWVSQQLFTRWPDTRPVMAYLQPQAGPAETILTGNAAVPRYYLYPAPAHTAVVSTSAAPPYRTPSGRPPTSADSWRQTVEDHRFTRIVLGGGFPDQDRRLAALLTPNGYRRTRTFPFHSTACSSVPFAFPETSGTFTVWERS
ncbi:glycosyltransferase family 39 protein [Kitasatospora sp. DSM 101779]|uniref:glycosyltransferase family 39 protein n=1 Tax=Kitasatospora sp. DSM 101779 TaxID=2853165 RepID=UPI0021D8DEC4|nr:glycosyltransferase family 39 protein [Kitasatospora sp. DSM 101779]MCU7825130.1 glycosyltransferase family 39 protein [Kitasatospora sp. DSM 101779]